MSRHRLSMLCLIIAWCLVSASPAVARPSFKVDVTVDLEVPGMTAFWTPEQQEEIISAARAQIVDRLRERFRHWTFGPEDGGAPLALALSFVERLGVVYAEMSPMIASEPADEPAFPISRVWLEPGDVSLRGYPSIDRAATELADAADRLMLEKSHKAAIREWLHGHVPIAQGGRWQDERNTDNLRIVLPLAWQEYEHLQVSKFRLDCKWQEGRWQGGKGRVMSTGFGSAAFYRPAEPQPPFEAIVVVPNEIVHPDGRTSVSDMPQRELRPLEFGPVYLLEFIDPGLAGWQIN